MNAILPVAVICLTLAFSQPATKFTAKVVGITDGDTITVLRDNGQIRIRLHGIDCPERGDDFSQKAKQFTSTLVFGKTVQVKPVDIDRYGRTVARIYIGEKDLSVELVRSGLAWHYIQYAPNDKELTEAEALAKSAGVGIWSLPNPAPPWGRASLQPKSESGSVDFHGNVRSKIFHAPSCRYYNCKNCIRLFSSREEAIAAGFRPCKRCGP